MLEHSICDGWSCYGISLLRWLPAPGSPLSTLKGATSMCTANMYFALTDQMPQSPFCPIFPHPWGIHFIISLCQISLLHFFATLNTDSSGCLPNSTYLPDHAQTYTTCWFQVKHNFRVSTPVSYICYLTICVLQAKWTSGYWLQYLSSQQCKVSYIITTDNYTDPYYFKYEGPSINNSHKFLLAHRL